MDETSGERLHGTVQCTDLVLPSAVVGSTASETRGIDSLRAHRYLLVPNFLNVPADVLDPFIAQLPSTSLEMQDSGRT